MLFFSLVFAGGLLGGAVSPTNAPAISIGEVIIAPQKQPVEQFAAYRTVGALDALAGWKVERRVTRDLGGPHRQPYELCDDFQTSVVATITVLETLNVSASPTKTYNQSVQIVIYDCSRHDVLANVEERGVAKAVDERERGFDRILLVAARTAVRAVASAYHPH